MKRQDGASKGEMHVPWEEVVLMSSQPWRNMIDELLWELLCTSIPTKSHNSDHGINAP